MTTIKFNDEVIDLTEFDCIYYLGQTSIIENEIFYNEMKNNRNKIYNVLDFYPYIMNIYFTNKYKSLEKKLLIQEDKHKDLERKFKFLSFITIIIFIIIIISNKKLINLN